MWLNIRLPEEVAREFRSGWVKGRSVEALKG
jgi:hypothetical protein